MIVMILRDPAQPAALRKYYIIVLPINFIGKYAKKEKNDGHKM